MKFIPDDDFIGSDDTAQPEKVKDQIIVSPSAAGEGVPSWLYLAAGALVLWFLLTRKNK